MPVVGGKKYPYTKKGKMQAKVARMKKKYKGGMKSSYHTPFTGFGAGKGAKASRGY